MPASEAMKRAIKKYEKEKVDRLIFRLPKGQGEIIMQHASEQGESTNAFVVRAVKEAMERDRQKR